MRSDNKTTAERLKKRLNVITVIMIAAMAGIAISLFLIKLIHGRSYTQATMNRSRSVVSISARRGNILDRNNILLASSTMEYKLILDPVILLTEGRNFLDITPRMIEKCFGISQDEVIQKAYDNPKSRYIILDTGLTYNDVREFNEICQKSSDEIRAFLGLSKEDAPGTIQVKGVWLEEGYRRNYTYGTFASSVLGFTANGVGQYGIEKYYDDQLNGTDGEKYSYLNDNNLVESTYREAQDGDTIQLTIDYNIESIVEKHMMDMLEESGAKTVAVTIQKADTGEFLAMADSGWFDPNNPRDLSVRYTPEEVEYIHDDDKRTNEVLSENWDNYCISYSYEPGSTFKAFTVAAGLEEGIIDEDDYFFCDGSVPMRDYIIHCAQIDGHGEISLTDALSESCNMAMMDIAEAEGVDIFSKYQAQFGFGPLTDIDLPNELNSKSLMRGRESLTDIDLATYSFGQGFNVTMVQMSSAFCSLINGGTYYKPFVVKGIYNAGGEQIKSAGRTVVSRPVSKETCDFIKQALRHTVTEGTGTQASVVGYITAGKTGTAQKGKRNEDLWVASFIGFAPYANPEVVCYVVIDEPASGGDGSSEYACELFSRIMGEVLPYLNAVPASMDYDPTGKGSPEPHEEDEESEEDGEDEEDEEDADEEDEEEEEEQDEEEEADEEEDYDYSEDYQDDYEDTYWEDDGYDYDYDYGYEGDYTEDDYYSGDYDYGAYEDEPVYDEEQWW